MDAIRAKTADIPGILVEVTAPRAGPPTGKPIQVQLGALDPARAAGGRQEGRGHPGGAPRHPRSRRRPAAARHRLEDRGRQGGGREIRRRRQHRRHRGAARHQRPEGDRIPARRQRQVGRHPGALPGRPAQPRPDRRSARADPGRPRADRQFRPARAGAARRLHQPRRRQPRDDGLRQRRRGRADREGAAGDRRASSPRPISGRA